MQFEWNGTTYNSEYELMQAVYRANVGELVHLTTAQAAAQIVASMGHDPRATGMFAQQRLSIATRAVDGVRDNPVTDRVLQVAKAHQASVKLAFKGDKSEWAKAYQKATKQFVDYLEHVNKGLSTEEAEKRVS